MVEINLDTQKTFFLGMGAGKSGSTWIYDYLVRNPDIEPGPLKEMRVLSHPEYRNLIRSALSLPYKKFEGGWWIRENAKRIWYRSDWNRYFSAYQKILDQGAMATGENSPGNMKLSKDVLVRVKEEFNRSGIRVVPIFIMRDPIDRLRSSISYRAKRNFDSSWKSSSVNDQEIILNRMLEGTESRLNRYSDYADTVRRIRSVFQPEDIFISFYEEVFSFSELKRLCSILGVDYLPTDTAKRANASGAKIDLPFEIKKKLLANFSDVYLDMSKLFGEEKIKSVWPVSAEALDIRKNR